MANFLGNADSIVDCCYNCEYVNASKVIIRQMQKNPNWESNITKVVKILKKLYVADSTLFLQKSIFVGALNQRAVLCSKWPQLNFPPAYNPTSHQKSKYS